MVIQMGFCTRYLTVGILSQQTMELAFDRGSLNLSRARLPVNNGTGNVPKSDEVSGVSKLDQSFADMDKTRPVSEVAQAKGSGGEPMTSEARRQYINLKRVRYQASTRREGRG